MAIPVRFIVKRTARRLEKGKSISPFIKTKKTPRNPPPITPPAAQRSNVPIFIIGGILLALLLKK